MRSDKTAGNHFDSKDAPTVSVIMPAYRAAEYIGDALESVLNQTYTDYEIIVVNDGSPDTDDLEQALEAYRDKIHYISQENRGCSAARNVAVRVARGGLVAFLDADDCWEPEYLQQQVTFLESNPSVDLVYADALLVGDSPLAGRTFMRTTPSRGEVTLQSLLEARCTVLLSGTLVRRQSILAVGLFDERLRCSEDYDLWLRLAMNGGRLAYQRKVLLSKRIHAASLSANHVYLHEQTLVVLEKNSLDPRLNEEERKALYALEMRLQATARLERGKQELTRANFTAASDQIRQANDFYRSWKLRLMLWWLRYSPRALLNVYNLRARLIAYRSTSDTESSASFTARAGWLFFAKCFAFGLSFVLPLLLVRRLSQHEFGLYKQVFLIVGTAIYILPLGFGMSAFYFLPRDRDRRDQVIFNILVFYVVMGGGACLALILRPSLLETIFGSDELTGYAPQIGLIILFWVVSSFLEVVTLANQESRLATLFIILSQLVKTALMLAAAISAASIEALMKAAIVYGVLQTATLLLYLRSRFGSFWRELDWRMIRTQASYALPIGLASVLFQVQMDLHNYFVSHQFSAAEFAIYAVGCFNLPLISILSESAGSVTIPRVSYLEKHGFHREIVELVARMLRKLSALYFPIYFFLLVMGREFITVLFTAQYESSWPIFAINLTMIPLGLVASACDPVMRAYAEHRFFMMKVRAAIIAVLLVALWFSTGRFGLVGAITVVVLFNLIERCFIAAKVGRVLKVSWHDAYLLKDLAKLAVAAFAAGVVTLIVRSYGLEAPPAILLAACGIVFSVVYVVAVLLLGVPTADELDIVERRIGRIPRLLWRRPALPLGGGVMNVGYGVWNSEAVAATAAPARVLPPILTRNPSVAVEVGELTQRRYWDLTHVSEQALLERKTRNSSRGDRSRTRQIKNSIKKLLGKRLLEYMGSYEDHLLWNVIYRNYLPKKHRARVLEVGSAPGDFLVRLSETFEFEPYGIEYSEQGVDLNRRIFAENNLNPNNIIHGDFLSDEFHKRYEGHFDMVVSRGFIEHFTDARSIVEKHTRLLASGGVLVISIPNLRGFNYLLARIFNKEVLDMHNLAIMRKGEFSELFDRQRVAPLYCNHYGTFNFGLFNARENSPLRVLLEICMKFQVALNVAFRLLLGEKGAESSFFSPALIFIGVKRDDESR
jgi:O-antigen/teichoic acid export membrane protein/GT2 family glycosyltransferase/2-polyprenyl-3-methyl-5-hydroxy-6-metoxy-1,4-benzoquinol methylase